MSLVRYNSDRNLRSFDSFFDNFFNNNMTDMIGSDQRQFTQPSVNIKETEDNFDIEVAAPGLTKEQFNIDVEDNVLTISAEQKSENEDSNDNYTRREFSYSSFKRSFNLPDTIQDDAIEAKYEDGVLRLTLPKKEEAKPQPPRRIEIG